MNLSRRIKKLEAARIDATGLVPHSEAWFAFYEDKLFRLMNGEDIGNMQIPIAVTDRIIAEADRADEAAAVARSSGRSE
jgi:hypothetical protein